MQTGAQYVHKEKLQVTCHLNSEHMHFVDT